MKGIVADDRKLDRKCFKGFLESVGCEVDEALNGEELVRKVTEGDYDFVVTDNRMPLEDDGIKAVKELRRLGYEGPICMISQEDLSERAIETGAQYFISKIERGSRGKMQEFIDTYVTS